MLTIDGQNYNLPVIKLTRKMDFLDKYAQRTESGDLERELIGVYFNYSLSIGMGTDPTEYERLWQKLGEAVEFHEVTVYDNLGTKTFTAYLSNVQDELMRYKDGKGYFKGLMVNYTAKSPART